ncbi:esterase/lipase family protein, partial [Cellulomonas cellasea]
PAPSADCDSASGADLGSAAAAPGRSNGYKTLILLHGFNKNASVNCNDYWGDGKVERYLNNTRGWGGKVRKLTYYWSGGSGCTRIPGAGGAGHAIEDLGSAFAWYIYNTYSRNGVPVDVIAHSMGGLVTRTAITGTQKQWRTASGRTFPPYLYIEDVATLSSPHEGARASVWGGCSTSRFQVCEMIPGSSFMRSWIAPYGNPQSKMGTDWSAVGSGADWVVNTGSALNTKASRHPGHKYLFLSGSGLDHAKMSSITEDGRGFNYPIKYCHYNASCNKANWDGWPQIARGAGPLWVAANAVYYSSW